ncbi:hypothetical protein [Geobacter sp.]|uniref:hypothetical protein n=1 Tax=Geobacter sp. TaxID=46610 RepID=UPI0027B9A8AF|nr:hypothetical protein [Geobacter sp.]
MTKRSLVKAFEVLSGALVLALFTAVLYLYGNAYHEGYLEAFGVNPVLFPYQLDRVLFAGYNALLRLWVKGLLPFLGLCGAIVVVAAICHQFSKTKTWQKIRNKIITDVEVKLNVFDKGFNLASLLFLLYFSALLFVVPSGMSKEIAFKEGVSIKNKVDREIENKRIIEPQIYVMSYDESGTKTATGHLVEASENLFAFYAPRKTIIVPREKLVSIKSATDILFLDNK